MAANALSLLSFIAGGRPEMKRRTIITVTATDVIVLIKHIEIIHRNPPRLPGQYELMPK